MESPSLKPSLLDIFSYEQVRSILKNREEYEERIERKEKSAFLQYIKMETKILQKIQSQPNVLKGQELRGQIICGIIRIYNAALSSFIEDFKMWKSYLTFCIEIGYLDSVTKSFSKLLDNRTTNDNLWQLAAKWELNQCNDIDKALEYLNKGTEYCPFPSSLYQQLLKLELSVAEKNECNQDEKMREDAEGKYVEIFRRAIKKEFSLDTYKEMLDTATNYKFTGNLQAEICMFISERFSKNEFTWNLLAQRELEGHHITENKTYKYITNLDERVKFCLQKYQQAVSTLPTESMWEKYLNTLVDIFKRQNSDDFIKEHFVTTFKAAHEKLFLSEEHYLVWTECLADSADLHEVLETATKNKPHSIKLWLARARYHFTKGEEDIVESVFEEAVKALGDSSTHIWRWKIQYYQLKHDNDNNRIEKIYRDGLKFSEVVSAALQPQYLEWIALTKNMLTVHEVYNELSSLKPFCIELHKKMAELEAVCSEPDQEIFKSIKTAVDNENNPIITKTWDDFVSQEVHCGPTWKRVVYMKYLHNKSK